MAIAWGSQRLRLRKMSTATAARQMAKNPIAART
jgi:hypothetical protein